MVTTSKTLFGKIQNNHLQSCIVFRLTDRNLDSSTVASLGLEALLLLSNGSPLDSIGSSDQTDSGSLLLERLHSLQRPQTIRIVLSQFLAENPRTLLIVDDIYLQETVDLFAGLKASFG